MAELTVIGRGTRVRGRVSGAVDLEIQGYVDGEIAVEGDVTIDAHGLVAASVSGRRLVVRGAVRGDLTGEDAVHLEVGARVVGDIRAPRVVLAPGALVRGYVQSGGDGTTSAVRRAPAARETPRTAQARPAAPPARPATVAQAAPAQATAAAAPNGSNAHVRPAPNVIPAASPASPPPRAAVPARASAAKPAAPPAARPVPPARPGPSPAASPKGPPAPVVPALKKGARGAIRKKA